MIKKQHFLTKPLQKCIVMASLSLVYSLPKAEDDLDGMREVQSSLIGMEMQDLLGLTITSASKKEQKLSEVATAMTVVTQEDIQRLGATNIPDILRSVPGLQVAKTSANEWAVTARGFLGVLASKLLVLIDGRSVYTPVFSGVIWDELDLVLEDIDRIEVIRGPGATIWGSNAVNGVINIITKSAIDTQGGLLVVGAGSEERAFGSLRYGGQLGKDINYRVFVKASERDNSKQIQGSNEASDDWNSHSAGFRMEWDGNNDSLLADGRLYYGHKGVSLNVPTLVPPFNNFSNKKYLYKGGHVLAQWEHDWSSTSEHKLQIYFDRFFRDDPRIQNEANTIDVEFDHRFQLNNNQEINWGVGYRYIDIRSEAGATAHSVENQYGLNLYNAFIQSEWRLFDESVILTLGSKIEHHYFTGINVQPSARVTWNITPVHTIWGSLSRALRPPSISDSVTQLDLFTSSDELANALVTLTPKKQDNEELLAYEIGYRFNPSAHFFINTSFYLHDFSQISSLELGPPSFQSFFPIANINLPIIYDTLQEGQVYGVEIDSKWNIFDDWQLNFSYTYSKMDLKRKSGNTQTSLGYISETGSPQQLVSIGSRFNFPYQTTLDFWFRYNDRITQLNTAPDNVKEYITLDIQASWKPIDSLRLSLVGQNLLDKHRLELTDEIHLTPVKEIERSVYFKLSSQF